MAKNHHHVKEVMLIMKKIIILFLESLILICPIRCIFANKNSLRHSKTYPSFFCGPLRKGDPPVLLVAAVEQKRGETGGNARLFVFQKEDLDVTSKNILLSSWIGPYYCAFDIIDVIQVPGDNTKQVVIQTVGVDTIGLLIFGFRGKNYIPKLLYNGHNRGYPYLLKQGKEVYIVERWIIWMLYTDGFIDKPLPKLENHVFAKRIFKYDKNQDKYILYDIKPDLEREQKISKLEFKTLLDKTRKIIKSMLKKN